MKTDFIVTLHPIIYPDILKKGGGRTMKQQALFNINTRNSKSENQLFSCLLKHANQYVKKHIFDRRYDKKDLIQEFMIWTFEKGYLEKKEFVTYSYAANLFRTFLNREWQTRRKANDMLLMDQEMFISINKNNKN